MPIQAQLYDTHFSRSVLILGHAYYAYKELRKADDQRRQEHFDKIERDNQIHLSNQLRIQQESQLEKNEMQGGNTPSIPTSVKKNVNFMQLISTVEPSKKENSVEEAKELIPAKPARLRGYVKKK